MGTKVASTLAVLTCLGFAAPVATAAGQVEAHLRPTGTTSQAGWDVATGLVGGGAFGPLAVGALRTATDPDGDVSGTLAVFGPRGWLITAVAGTRQPDGLLRANLGFARGAGRFRSVQSGTVEQHADGTLIITVRRTPR